MGSGHTQSVFGPERDSCPCRLRTRPRQCRRLFRRLCNLCCIGNRSAFVHVSAGGAIACNTRLTCTVVAANRVCIDKSNYKSKSKCKIKAQTNVNTNTKIKTQKKNKRKKKKKKKRNNSNNNRIVSNSNNNKSL